MKKSTEDIALPFESLAFAAKWKEWLQYRSQRKLPKYVPLGLQKTFTKLKRDSGGIEDVAMQMIEQSMEMNYQGLFPLKNQTNGVGKGNTADRKPGTSEARISRAKDW